MLTSDMDFLSLALRRAQAIAQADATSGVALSNLASIAFGMGDTQLAWTTAQQLADRPDSSSRSDLMGRGLIALT